MKPLEGIRVLDLSRMVAGPTAAMLLADLGADVIKIEPPAGDDARYMNWRYAPQAAPFFVAANRNKRGIVLDLRSQKGLAVLDRLVRGADVLLHNYVGSLAEDIGLGYERLRAINPRLIYCAVSAFGEKGPWSQRPGIDSLVQAMSGLMSVTGEADQRPLRVGVPLIDTTSAVSIAASVCAALYGRERTGQGERIGVSLLGQAAFMQGPMFAFSRDIKADPPRMGNRSPLALIIEAVASDGTLFVGIPTDKFWRRFCEAVGVTEAMDREELRTQRLRIQHQDLIHELVAEPLRRGSVAHWLEVFGKARLPCAPLLTYTQALAHPQVVANDFFLEVDMGAQEPAITARAPWVMSSCHSSVDRPPPALGEHTTSVLIEAGLTPEEVAELEREGVTQAVFSDPWGEGAS